MGSKIAQQKKKDFLSQAKDNITAFMLGIGLWEESMYDEIPNNFQKFHNYILIKDVYFAHENWKRAGPSLWQLISGLMGGIPNIALYGKINNDQFRSPNVTIVYGNDEWVNFLDNGIKYFWKVEKVMFSQGNLIERHRIAKLDCRNQVVVDMFAGIGYFTLPYLVHAKAQKVIAVEWNPDAVTCLEKNLLVNGVDKNCVIRVGDVKNVCDIGVADHVNLGLIPSSEEYWETGALALKQSGGILHVHGLVSAKPAPSNRTESLREEAEHIEDGDKCIKCITLMLSLHHPLGSSASFGLDLTADGVAEFDFTKPNGCVWKKPAFLEWSVHVTHSIALHLVNIHQFGWRVKPVYFNRIKKYAPHLFHVVVDIHCQPL